MILMDTGGTLPPVAAAVKLCAADLQGSEARLTRFFG
jgi:hypothetical protein